MTYALLSRGACLAGHYSAPAWGHAMHDEGNSFPRCFAFHARLLWQAAPAPFDFSFEAAEMPKETIQRLMLEEVCCPLLPPYCCYWFLLIDGWSAI